MTYPRTKPSAPWPALPWRVVFTAFETEIRDARDILIARIPLAAGNRGVTAGAEEMRTYALLLAAAPELTVELEKAIEQLRSVAYDLEAIAEAGARYVRLRNLAQLAQLNCKRAESSGRAALKKAKTGAP